MNGDSNRYAHGYVKIGYEWGYGMNGDMIHNKLYKGDMNGDMMHSQWSKMDFTINFYGGFYREKLLKSVAFPFAKWSMNAGFPYLCWFGLSKTILGRQSMMTGHKTHIRGYIISVFRYKHRFLALFFMRSFIPTTDWWRDTWRQCGESPAFCWWNL